MYDDPNQTSLFEIDLEMNEFGVYVYNDPPSA
jgi:hypothetical protein